MIEESGYLFPFEFLLSFSFDWRLQFLAWFRGFVEQIPLYCSVWHTCEQFIPDICLLVVFETAILRQFFERGV